MTSERWQQVNEILREALQLAPEQRPAFLDQACAGDRPLRKELESLLSSSDETRATLLASAAAHVVLSKGTRLGDYEVQSLLGTGGMGEVYRARDLRLERQVAVKVLPASLSSDRDRLRRFEQEARAAAALNHPNILAVFQMGTYQGAPYLVSELLEGLTLREHLRRGPLPVRKAVDYATQIAHGLAAAHDKGIVHRDLKPENLFVTKDGRVKILDFGLAKLTHPQLETTATTRNLGQPTEPGMLLGTVGYMSPEQVRGESADHRSDIFAFGAMLYEMLTRKQAFHGVSAVETMGAILKDDPPPLVQVAPTISPGLQRIVHRCLEKVPKQRFHSASDLGFALESLSVTSESSLALSSGTKRARQQPRLRILAALVACVLIALGAVLAGLHFTQRNPLRFEDVILRRGQFGQARFAPDGRTVVYTASFRFGERGVYVADANTQVGRALGMPYVVLLAVSRNSELAVLLSPHVLFEHASNAVVGTLARVPLSGGTPRPVLENVQAADWNASGSELAISRYNPEKNTYTLEYPIGHVLYETKGYISDVRVSPDEKFIAFMDHPVLGDNIGSVAVVDQLGKHKMISPESWPKSWGEEGLAWAPSGDEVWFTNQNGLWASDLRGRTRPLLQMAGYGLYLRDIARDGTLLLYQFAGGTSMTLHTWTKSVAQRDLSWLDLSIVTDISEDGKVVLFTEGGIGGGPEYMMYLRNTDGSPAVQLSSGRFGSISPDGQSAITTGFKVPMQLFLVPLSLGETRPLTNDSINHFESHWLPDNTHFVFVGQEPGQGVRTYLQTTHGDSPKAITPEGCGAHALSLDGTLMLAECVGTSRWKLFPLNGDQPSEPKGFQPGDAPIRWTKDRSLWVLNSWSVNSARIFKVNPLTGSRVLWKEIYLDSFSGIQSAVITPDGNTFVHTDWANFGSLRKVYGLR